jgi:hypothetical protein
MATTRAVALATLSFALIVGPSHGLMQSPAPATSLRFEVASVRQNMSGETRAELRVESGGRLTATNYTLFDLVRNAWGVQPFQIIRGERVPDGSRETDGM